MVSDEEVLECAVSVHVAWTEVVHVDVEEVDEATYLLVRLGGYFLFLWMVVSIGHLYPDSCNTRTSEEILLVRPTPEQMRAVNPFCQRIEEE